MASIHGINISPGMNARGPAAPVGPEGNCSRAPTARPSGPRDPLLAADAPTAAPEATPARAKIAATSTPRSAMPSEAASARNGRHVGWRHGRPAQRRKRLGLMRCQRHHQPDAGCRKQNRLPHALSPLTFNCRPAHRRQLPPTLMTSERRPPPDEPTRPLPRLMSAAVLAGPGGSDACPEVLCRGRRPDGGRSHGAECPHGAVRLGRSSRGDPCLVGCFACHRPPQASGRGRTGGRDRPAGGRQACSGLASFLSYRAGPPAVALIAAPFDCWNRCPRPSRPVRGLGHWV